MLLRSETGGLLDKMSMHFKTFHRIEISTQQREETGEAIEDPDKL